MKNSDVYLNVLIKSELHRNVKSIAAKQGKTMIEIVHEALTDLIKKNQKDD